MTRDIFWNRPKNTTAIVLFNVWKATPNINILNSCVNDISQVCVKQANMIYKDKTLNWHDNIDNIGEVEDE